MGPLRILAFCASAHASFLVFSRIQGKKISESNSSFRWTSIWASAVQNRGSFASSGRPIIRHTRGKKTTPLTRIGKSAKTGNVVRFKPDPDVFEVTEFRYEVLEGRLRELAFLNAGLSLSIEDERTGEKDTFKYAGGLKAFVKYLNENERAIHSPIFHFSGERDGVAVEIALQYNDTYAEQVVCYTNNIPQRDGGTHQ